MGKVFIAKIENQKYIKYQRR